MKIAGSPAPVRAPIWVYVAIVVCAIASLASISYRFRMERRNRAVGLCLEMQVIRNAAVTEREGLSDTLLQAKQHGLTAVSLSEERFTDLVEDGSVRFLSPGILTGEPRTLRRIEAGLEARFGYSPRAIGTTLSVAVLLSELLDLAVGIDPDEASAARDAGLLIIARHGNAPGATQGYILSTLRRSRDLGATIYLPEGDQALGQKKLLDLTASTMANFWMFYAAPEFVKIGGDAFLAEKSIDRLIRLHSIQAAEVDRMSPSEIEERYIRAYRERNIRLLLLRPMTQASVSPVESLFGVLDVIRAGVEKEGGRVGIPRPYTDPQVPTALFMVIGFSAAVVTIWVGLSLVRPRILQAIGVFIVLALAAACWSPQGRLYMATLAAIAFPISTYLLLEGQRRIVVWRDYLLLSLVSLVGGLAVAGLLNELPYYTRVDQFFAVKLAHFGPILIIGWMLMSRRFDLRRLSASPIAWGSAIVGIMVLMAVALMLARTGNENPAAVSDLELRFRGIMDAVLFARPRTKEFLIGNPAFWIGLCMLAAVRNRSADGADLRTASLDGYAVLFLTLGAIGQTSIVNTLCHTHTPIDLSLARIGTGLVLGGTLGALLWWVIRSKLNSQPDGRLSTAEQ